ncbi:MAG: hypothetical protein RLZZ182_1840 [Pseudomonadota bacterium]
MSTRVGSPPAKFRYRGWIASYDCNNATEVGWYIVGSGHSNIPPDWPSAGGASEGSLLEVYDIPASTGYPSRMQRITNNFINGALSGEGMVWVRGQNSDPGSGVWSEWRHVAIQGANQRNWTAASYSTGWTNSAGYANATRYRVVGNRVDVLIGAELTGVTNSTIFTLPTGYRPAGHMSFPASLHDSGTLVQNTALSGFITVLDTGVVHLLNPPTGTVVVTQFSFFLNQA